MKKSLETLRAMGKDEFERKCVEFGLRVVGLVMKVAEQVIRKNQMQDFGDREINRKRISSTLDSCRQLKEIKAVEHSTDFDPIFPINMWVKTEFTRGDQLEQLDIHWMLWSEVRELLSEDDRIFAQLLRNKCQIELSCQDFIRGRRHLTSLGMDLENPRIW